ncbi:MAG TPA: thioesterase family protein [Acidimicrobiia bacterium]|nr:thioesterase family protein [Acidimicrobiia bacterium]
MEPLGEGRFAARLDERWNCPVVPQGGIVAATAARAMATALADPTQQLRSFNGVFAGQVGHGPIEVDVKVLRRGRSMSQLHASLRNPGMEAGFDAFGVFGAEREGFTFTDLTPPTGLTPPLECPSFRDPAPEDIDRLHFNFWDHVQGRPTIGHAPWDDYEPVSSLCAFWYRFDDPPRADDGTWDPLALLALCDTMPGAVGERLGPEARQRRWLPPSADLTVHVLDNARSEWVLGVNRARHAGQGYASADMELWDLEAAPRLVAYGTQTMLFSFPK